MARGEVHKRELSREQGVSSVIWNGPGLMRSLAEKLPQSVSAVVEKCQASDSAMQMPNGKCQM